MVKILSSWAAYDDISGRVFKLVKNIQQVLLEPRNVKNFRF
jgi:hypothetical protein